MFASMSNGFLTNVDNGPKLVKTKKPSPGGCYAKND